MAARVVRLGEPRGRREGVRLGTARHLPRGVRKQDYAKRNYFDLWLPELSPSGKLVSFAQAKPWTDGRWTKFSKAYRREMAQPSPARLLDVLALLSRRADFSVGCYCEDESRCHRSVLRTLLREHGARLAR
jgi:uncharacterized protein YeaO (DUF488 family)